MANFVLSTTPPAMYPGGPLNTCSVCKFPNEKYEWYLTVEGVYVEEPHPSFNGAWTEKWLVFCNDHALELKSALDDIAPDERIPSLQAKLFQAEAARARAEKRAEAAEAVVHSMQDWITSTEDAK